MSEDIIYHLESFEGPLDLLLTLIEKNKIDICNIEISVLLEQYMDYIDKAQQSNIELASEFVDMASTLLLIKSRLLLPKETEEEDPKALLEQRLIEYAKCKAAAAFLAENSRYGRIFFRDWAPEGLPKIVSEYNYPAMRLAESYANVVRRNEGKKPLSAKTFNELIATRFISVGSKIISLLRLFVRNTRVSFRKLFRESSGRSETVAIFLAVLELIRSGRIDAVDENGETDLVLVRNNKGDITK